MTDDSDFVLRLEINNATATLATGRAESGVFNQGGFRWTTAVERRDVAGGRPLTNFILKCAMDHNGPWKTEGTLSVCPLLSTGSYGNWIENEIFVFDENNSRSLYESVGLFTYLSDNSRINFNDKVTMEFRIQLTHSERSEMVAVLSKLSAPNNRSDAILTIGEMKLHVSKEYLAVHSPVFEAMFFGDYVEKGKEEIEIKDVVYEEFLDLLQLIYMDTLAITDRTIPHILKLADRFQMERVMTQAMKCLMQSKSIDVTKKLMFADQYRLVPLTDHCLLSFTSASDLGKKLKSIPEYASFSNEMKASICDRMVALN